MSSYIQGAARHCHSKNFQLFLSAKTNADVTNPETAAAQLRDLCGIQSRRELGHNPRARSVYVSLLNEYSSFMRGIRS